MSIMNVKEIIKKKRNQRMVGQPLKHPKLDDSSSITRIHLLMELVKRKQRIQANIENWEALGRAIARKTNIRINFKVR